MVFKILSLTLLITCNVTAMHISNTLSQTPYPKENALHDLTHAGYAVKAEELVLKGNQDTGANFADAIITCTDSDGKSFEMRIVCYGPGRYVKAHKHDEKEIFVVTHGGCTVWLFQDGKWIESTKQGGNTIAIDAGVIHCLIAGTEGLCMHVSRNDMTRSVDFVTMPSAWELDAIS